jgi:murein DD-endopeptidase MepM/ murein hydrolase activator NlpD
VLPDLPPPPGPVPAIVRPFDPPAEDWHPGHRGIDLLARTGTPVRSLTSGVVGTAGPVAGKPVVTVLLPDGRRVTYEPVIAVVSPGEPVVRGQLLGSVAASGGHCGGMSECLHVGLRDDVRYLDPARLLARAVLKPTRRPAPGPPADAAG